MEEDRLRLSNFEIRGWDGIRNSFEHHGYGQRNDIINVYQKMLMRALVDIPEEDLKALGDLGKVKHMSRASLIRQAVSQYLTKQRADSEVSGFGLWKGCGRQEDGLAYQDRMRREWER